MRRFGEIRKQMGLPRWRAAARLGISEGYLGQLERGTAPLSLSLAGRMARAYGVSASDILRRRSYLAEL